MYLTLNIDEGILLLILFWLTFMFGLKLAKGTFLEQRITKKIGITTSVTCVLVFIILAVI
jgi:hypothetical protein